MSSSLYLRADDLAFSYGAQVVFDGVSLVASAGRRLGLVGENGVGKSTLLRLLAGVEEPHGGSITCTGDVGFLLQELPFPMTARVSDVVDDALSDIRAAADRLALLTERIAADPDDAVALAEYGLVLEWAQIHDLWDADRRAELVLAGLGLSGVSLDRRLATLSGGQRSRLGLAALLVRRPSTLLLDEPTNHLDDGAMEFLEEHLATLGGVVVLSSHDRVFLDAVCTDIVDLDPALGGPARYGGAYSGYLVRKRAERTRWEQRFAEEQHELDELRHAVAVTAREVAPHDRPTRDSAKMIYDFKAGRVQKQVSRRVRNARARLDELDRAQVRKPPAPLEFRAPPADAPVEDRLAISVRDVEVPGRLRIGRVEVSTTSRLLVTGANGAGKSTLLAMLAGRLEPAGGVVHRARGVRVGLLEQDVVFADPARTARRLYTEAVGEHAPPLARLGLIAPKDLDKEVGHLSVGQRRRLALAMLMADPPDVLLLDEPTNHISLTLAEELSDALDTAPGAVVVASHDRWLRRGWTGERLELTAVG